MKLNRTMIPVGALLVALGFSGYAVEAGQRDSRGRDRNGRDSQGQTRQRDSAPPPAARAEGQNRGGDQHEQRPQAQPQPQARGGDPRAQRQERVAPREQAQDRGARQAPPQVAPEYRGAERGREQSADPRRGGLAPQRRDYDLRDNGRPAERRRDDDRRDAYRYDGYRNDGNRGYTTPRGVPGRQARPHFYGSGGNFSVYFGLGNGYLFGSPWSGRVYGYASPRAYGSRIYYGDVRLQVRPREAAVYVDGYYAGIVDDFDGVFQRLTLEVGPHQIELDAPGLEPQMFDIYVDPARTVDIRTDLYRY